MTSLNALLRYPSLVIELATQKNWNNGTPDFDKNMTVEQFQQRLVHSGIDVLNSVVLNTLEQHTGYTLLMHAASVGNIAIMEYLIQKKADVNAVGWQGRTALSVAVENRQNEAVAYLLQKGADVKSTQYIIKRFYRGNTVLHIAARVWNLPAAHLLMKYGADVDAKNGNRKTPYKVAITAAIDKFYDLSGLKKNSDIIVVKIEYEEVKKILEVAEYIASKGNPTSLQWLAAKSLPIQDKKKAIEGLEDIKNMIRRAQRYQNFVKKKITIISSKKND